VPHNYIKETHGIPTSYRYQIFDYNWSEDYPGHGTDDWKTAVDLARTVSEGCIKDAETGMKYEIFDGIVDRMNSNLEY
jgi:hypothetical protein